MFDLATTWQRTVVTRIDEDFSADSRWCVVESRLISASRCTCADETNVDGFS
jgi:hypothetical protein